MSIFSFARELFAAPFARRRARRAELESRFETFLKVATRMALVFQQEFAPDAPPTTPIGRGLSRLATTISDALFSQREQLALTAMLRPGKVRDLERLRDEYVDAALALSHVAPDEFRDAVERLTSVIDRWASDPAPERVDEWSDAIRNLKTAYEAATNPRRIRRALAAVVSPIRRDSRSGLAPDHVPVSKT